MLIESVIDGGGALPPLHMSDGGRERWKRAEAVKLFPCLEVSAEGHEMRHLENEDVEDVSGKTERISHSPPVEEIVWVLDFFLSTASLLCCVCFLSSRWSDVHHREVGVVVVGHRLQQLRPHRKPERDDQ